MDPMMLIGGFFLVAIVFLGLFVLIASRFKSSGANHKIHDPNEKGPPSPPINHG